VEVRTKLLQERRQGFTEIDARAHLSFVSIVIFDVASYQAQSVRNPSRSDAIAKRDQFFLMLTHEKRDSGINQKWREACGYDSFYTRSILLPGFDKPTQARNNLGHFIHK